jgi:hypothetical protein
LPHFSAEFANICQYFAEIPQFFAENTSMQLTSIIMYCKIT